MIKSSRNDYIPAHTTKEVRKALFREMQRLREITGKRMSRSKLIHQLICEGLHRRGYTELEVNDLGVK